MDNEMLNTVYEYICGEVDTQKEKRIIYISTLISNPFIFKDDILKLMSLNEKQTLDLEYDCVRKLKMELLLLKNNKSLFSDFIYISKLSIDLKSLTDNLLIQDDTSDLFQAAVLFKIIPDNCLLLSRRLLGNEYLKCLDADAIYRQMLEESNQKFNLIKENSEKILRRTYERRK